MRAKTDRIFLSYASEDGDRVEALYDALRTDGLNPWMDRKDLEPGRRWEPAILSALRSASIVLVCLTERSVSKRGFLQREIRQALSLEEERLPEDTYIVPCRLEPCAVPPQLAVFQWVDLYESRGLARLVQVLKSQLAPAGVTAHLPSASTRPQASEKRISWAAAEPRRFSVDIAFPEFRGLPDHVLFELNARVAGIAMSQLHACRTAALLDPEPNGFAGLSYRIAALTPALVSIEFYETRYFEGAAHPNHGVSALNVILEPVFEVSLGDLFADRAEYPKVLSELCRTRLRQTLRVGSTEAEGTEDWILEGTAPEASNFGVALLRPDAVTIVFQEYQVAAYASGAVYVDLPWSVLKAHVRKLPVLDRTFDWIAVDSSG